MCTKLKQSLPIRSKIRITTIMYLHNDKYNICSQYYYIMYLCKGNSNISWVLVSSYL